MERATRYREVVETWIAGEDGLVSGADVCHFEFLYGISVGSCLLEASENLELWRSYSFFNNSSQPYGPWYKISVDDSGSEPIKLLPQVPIC